MKRRRPFRRLRRLAAVVERELAEAELCERFSDARFEHRLRAAVASVSAINLARQWYERQRFSASQLPLALSAVSP